MTDFDYQAMLDKQAAANPDCKYCQEVAARGDTMAPRHDPMPNCESGKRPHCTCDVCF